MSKKTWAILHLALVLALLLSLTIGSAQLSVHDLLSVATGQADATITTIIWQLRLPRTLLGIGVGAALGCAGSTMQFVLRNPLAEPYLLGVSGGAAVGAVVVFTLGAASTGALSAGAFVGAIVAVGTVLSLARATGGLNRDPRVLVTIGVAVGALTNATIMILMSAASPTAQRSALWWMMGSLSAARWNDVVWLGAVTLVVVAALVQSARSLDAVALGPDAAASLGVRPERATAIAFMLGSLLAATTVATAGLIGFVGLIVPHVARSLGARSARRVLMVSALSGAILVVCADIVARVARAPVELPLGAVTAALGAPFFLSRLRRLT